MKRRLHRLRDDHAKWSQRKIPDDITCMWNLKYDPDELTKQKQTHRHREQTCGCHGGVWEFGISRGKLLYIGWISKILLYSTGNYIQYPTINHNGKVYEKECIYAYNGITLLYSRN